MPPLLARDEFTGVPSRPSTGAAEYTTTDNEKRYFRVTHLAGTPSTGDQAEYTLTFPEGTVTFRAEWTSATVLVLKRISTIPGTSNGTATLRTFSGASTSKPNLTDGSLVRMGLTVNRGAVNGVTVITFSWHGRSSTGTLEQTTDNVNFDGELTPTAGAFSLTGSLWQSIVHIEGRTPDGGGSPALAVGTYFQNMGVDHHRLHPAEFIHIITDGEAVPGLGSFGDLVYSLRGTGASADQLARLYWTADPAGFATAILSARLTGTWEIEEGPLNGYMLFLFSNADGTISCWLYSWEGGVAFFLDDEDVVNDGDQHFYELECLGDQVIVRMDGAELFSLSDGTHVNGDPGFGGYRDSVADAGGTWHLFEVEAEGGSVPCDAEISRHDFNVSLSSLDEAALTNGNFDQHPVSAEGAKSSGGLATKTPVGIGAAGASLHLGKNIVGLTDDYCVEARGVIFPIRDTGGAMIRRLIWEDTFESLGSGASLDGRTGAPGGLAGDGVWTRHLSGNEFIDGATCVGDGAGRVKQPAGGAESTSHSLYAAHGLTIPAAGAAGPDVDVEIDIYRNHEGFGGAGSLLRYQEAGEWQDGYKWYVFRTWNGVDEGLLNNLYRAWVGSQPIGGIGGPFHHDVGITSEYEARMRDSGPGGAGRVDVYQGGTRDFADGNGEAAFYDGQFTGGDRDNFPWGTAGIMFRGLAAENPLRIAGFRVYDYAFIPGVPALERGVVGVGVRYDEASNTGYRLESEFDHSTEPWTSELRLVCWDANVRTIMRTYPSAGASHGSTASFTLSVQGNILTVLHNGLQIDQFDLEVDTADESGDVVPIFATGFPALSLESDHDGDVTLDAWIVYGQSGDVPCEDPNNPPNGPPPLPPPELYAYEYPHSLGAWRLPELPSSPHGTGQYHTVIPPVGEAVKWVTMLGQWVPILFFDGETIPEPEYPWPPHHDPCYIVPPIDPGPLDPITSRFFGPSNSPLGSMGALFNGTQKAVGPWYTSDLPFMASRSSTLVGGPGGGSRIKLGGNRWDYNFFLDGWRAILTPIYPTLLTYASLGTYFGQSIADDVTSASLWGRVGGIPMDEFALALATLKAEFPGIRMGARMRPSQAPFDIGADLYFLQHTAERGDAYTLAANEYNICLARNAYLILGINWLHGGDGGAYGGDFPRRYANGTIKGQSAFNWMASPTEIAVNGPAMIDACVDQDGTGALVAGFLGYQYLAEYMGLADGSLTVIEGMTVIHNAIAAMPALP